MSLSIYISERDYYVENFHQIDDNKLLAVLYLQKLIASLSNFWSYWDLESLATTEEPIHQSADDNCPK